MGPPHYSDNGLPTSQQNGYRTGGVVRNGQIGDAIAIEVSCGNEKRIFAGREIEWRSKGSISVAEEDGYRVATGVCGDEIGLGKLLLRLE